MPPTPKTPGTTNNTTGQTKNAKSRAATVRRAPTTGGGRGNRTLWIALGGAALVAVALIGGSLLLRGGDDDGSAAPGGTGSTALVDDIPQNGTTLGNPDAPVTLIQFEDFQCPACRTYEEEAFAGIVEQYVRPGKVNVQFQGLTFLGPDSEKALRATLAAGEQGKLWQMQHLLYQNQGGENDGWVSDELIDELATTIGLDVEQLRTDMESQAVTDQVAAMQEKGNELGVQGTPSFFVSIDGGEPYAVQPEAFTVAAFSPIFEDALQG
jgi:protein-disulfide isomerase